MEHVHAALAQVLPRVKRELLTETPFIIGGGYLRDTYAGVQPKDIDVFVPPSYMGLEDPKDFEKYTDSELLSVATVPNYSGGLPIEVIVLGPQTPFSVDGIIGRFDLGLCKIAADQDGNIVADDQFFLDMEHELITVCRLNATNPDRVKGRIARMLSKYPSFNVNDPDGLLNG